MKLISKLNSMSLGKKIYAGLWAVTGGLLIALIVMFVSMNNTYNKTTNPENGWTSTTINSGPGVTYGQADAEPVVLKASPTKDVVDTKGKTVVAKGADPKTVNLTFADVKYVEAFKEYFEFKKYDLDNNPKTDAVALYALDAWKTTKTAEAKNATNATATVGALFGLSLVGTIFTTVGVSVYEKRKGGRK